MKKVTFLLVALLASVMSFAADVEAVGGLFKPDVGGFYSRASRYSSLTVNGTDVPVLDGYNRSGDYLGYDLARFVAPKGVKTVARLTSVDKVSSISVHPIKLGIEPVKIDDYTYEFDVPDPAEVPYYLFVNVNGNHIVVTRDVPKQAPAAAEGVWNLADALAEADIDATQQSQAVKVAEVLQSVIDKATAYGTDNSTRGVVYIPDGLYYLGNVIIKSNVEIFLGNNAVLRAIDDKSIYRVDYHKNSLDRDGTWWLSTVNDPENPTRNAKIHGYGTIDANGYLFQKRLTSNADRFGITALHIIHAENIEVDGVTVLETPMWGTMLGRSNDITMTNIKFLNSTDANENDGIDVNESQHVTIDRSIGIALDDPYSTKTWRGQELFKNWTGNPEQLDDVTFNHCVSWTYCGGFKMGHGAQQLQTNVRVLNGVVLNSGRAIGIEPKYANEEPTSGFHDVLFENIDIEHASGEGWLKILAETPGVGYPPIKNVTLRNINIRERGSASSLRGTNEEFIVDGVTFDNITMFGNTEPVKTLAELNITNTGYYKNVKFVQDATYEASHKIEAEYCNELKGGSRVENTGDKADTENPGGCYISGIPAGNYLYFHNVDFGSASKTVTLRIYNARSIFNAVLRIDNPENGAIVATGEIAKNSSWTNVELPLTGASGIHDLYVSFEKVNGPSDQVGGLNYLVIGGREVNDLESIAPNTPDVEVNIYMAKALEVEYTPADAYQRDLKWTIVSQEPADCITLSADGVVSANKVGTAVVEARSQWNSDIVATFNISAVDKMKFKKLRVEAESADAIYSPYHYDAAMSIGSVSDPEETGAQGLNSLWNTNFAVYNKVNFGDGAVKATIRKGYVRGSAMEIWIDPEIDTEAQTISGGTKIGEVEYPAIDSDWSRWATFETPILGAPTGEHTLVLYFKAGGGSAENQNYGALNWVEFTLINNSATSDLEALTPVEADVKVNLHLSKQLEVNFTPEDAYQRDVEWVIASQEPEGCISLTADGVVEALAVGKAVVEARSTWNNDIKASFNVEAVDEYDLLKVRVEAEDADAIYSPYHYDAAMSIGSVSDPDEPGARGLNSLWNTNFAVYNNVDFRKGAYSLTVRKGYVRGSAMEIWIDPEIDTEAQTISGGTKIGEVEYPAIASDWSRWATFETPIVGSPEGVHTVVLYFKAGGGSATNQNYGALNWVEFSVAAEPGELEALEADDVEVNVNLSKQLSVRAVPAKALHQEVTYSLVSATPEGCVELTAEGVVKGIAAGSAVVRATSTWNEAIYEDFNVNVVEKYDFAKVRIEAEDADAIYSPYHYDAAMSIGAVSDPDEPGARGLNSLWNTNFAVYNNVDLRKGAYSLTIRKGYVRGSAMEIWIDPEIDTEAQTISGGTKIGEVEYPAIDKDWSRWATFETPIVGSPEGVHTVVLYFKAGGGSATNQNYGALNWVEFSVADEPADIEALEADDVEVNVELTKQLSVRVVPEKALHKEVTYSLVSATPEGCVELTAEGVVKGIAVGSAVVRATSTWNEAIYVDFNVNVVNKKAFVDNRLQLEDADFFAPTYQFSSDKKISPADISDKEDESTRGYVHAWHTNFVVFDEVDFQEGIVGVKMRKELPRNSGVQIIIDPVIDRDAMTLNGGETIADFVFQGQPTGWGKWYTWDIPFESSHSGKHTVVVRHYAAGGTNTNQDFGGANWIELRTYADAGVKAEAIEATADFRVGTDGADILIHASQDTLVSIYTIDGRLVRNFNAAAGVSRVSGLEKGIYIVNRTKVVL